MIEISTERRQAFDLTRTKKRWSVPTQGAEVCRVSGDPHTTWSGGVVTVYQSLDGVTPYALDEAVTLDANEASAMIDTSTSPFLLFVVTTAAAIMVNLVCVRGKSRA